MKPHFATFHGVETLSKCGYLRLILWYFSHPRSDRSCACVCVIQCAVPLPFGVTSVTRSSTVTCSRPFSLITSEHKNDSRHSDSWNTSPPIQTHTYTGAHITFAVCLQLILPPTLHQLCPEQFLQPAATFRNLDELNCVSFINCDFKPFVTAVTADQSSLTAPVLPSLLTSG